MLHTLLKRCLFIFATQLAVQAYAGERSCYQNLEPEYTPVPHANSLYILLDQTMPLTDAMRNDIRRLTSDWPQANESVRLVRFSSFIGNQYPELIFTAELEALPDEEYSYNLRDSDRDKLMKCLAQTMSDQKANFDKALQHSLNNTKPSLATRDILMPLKRIADNLIARDDSETITILVITNGMEKSDIADFSQRKRRGDVDADETIARLEKRGLTTDWRQAKIYAYGLGQPKQRNQYVPNRLMVPLKQFWQIYYSSNNGIVAEVGTPALLGRDLRRQDLPVILY